MNNRTALSFKVADNKIFVLDQRRLPKEEVWIESHTIENMIYLIKELAVRGAPLIAIAAAYALAKLAETGATKEELLSAKNALLNSRPTAVNLRNVLDLQIPSGNDPDPAHIIGMAEKLFDDDVAMCGKIADFGASLLGHGEGIVHHCNTGGLATAGVGTALGIIKRAHEIGKKPEVFVDETRPKLQGARLTVWELKKAGILYNLITDSMAAVYMKMGKITKALVGADRIASNGDFANKVGTYGLAVLCSFHGISFIMAAPTTTFDMNIKTGEEIPIEQRDGDEVRGYVGADKEGFIWAPGAKVLNPAFDVTPASLLSAIVTDRGVITKEQIKKGDLNFL